MLTETANGEARALAERIRMEIAAQNGAIPAITVSCGIAELDEPVEPWVALDRADSALRDAKRSGRNRVAVAGRTSPGERVMLVEELERDTARRAALAVAVATLEVRDTGTAEHSDDVLTSVRGRRPPARLRRLRAPAPDGGRAAARCRQGGDPVGDPEQAGRADRGRVGRHPRAHHHRRAHPALGPRDGGGRDDRPPFARALGRQRLSGRLRRRAHTAGKSRDPVRRRVPRDALRPPLPPRAARRRRDRRARGMRRHAVRPCCRQCVGRGRDGCAQEAPCSRHRPPAADGSSRC